MRGQPNMFNWDKFVNERENREDRDVEPISDSPEPSFSLYQFKEWLKDHKEDQKIEISKPEEKKPIKEEDYKTKVDSFKKNVRKRIDESIERKVQERKKKKKD